MVTHPRTSIKLGLALSGGSTLGLAHVGVLKAFVEEGISIDCLSGTSAGSLAAGCFAFGMSPREIAEATTDLDWKKLSRFGYSRLGFYSNKPTEAFVTNLLGDVRIEDAPIPLAIVATDIKKHEKVVILKGSLAEAVRASTCIPGYFTPVSSGDRLLVDGSLTENLPLSPLKALGATVVIGVNLAAKPPSTPPHSMLGIITASFETLSQHYQQYPISHADLILEPDLSHFDSSSFKESARMIDAGYEAARMRMPEIRALLGIEEPRKNLFSALRTFFAR